MTPSALRNRLRTLALELDAATPTIIAGRTILEQIRPDGHRRNTGYDTTGGNPTIYADGPDGPEQIPSTSTELAALTGDPDGIRRSIRDIDRHTETLTRTLNALLAETRRWITKGAPPAPGELNTTLLDPGCSQESRLRHARRGSHAWAPVHVYDTDAAGNLPTRVDLCRWCYDFARQYGRLPELAELERHHRGERVRVHETP